MCPAEMETTPDGLGGGLVTGVKQDIKLEGKTGFGLADVHKCNL